MITTVKHESLYNNRIPKKYRSVSEDNHVNKIPLDQIIFSLLTYSPHNRNYKPHYQILIISS